ncbi:hypothetical protein NSERUTF1_6526 [Nocardia seriolae]|nr:hypothetical protein NSERUTF1_6526 [Nocardia seriolae]
MIHEPRLAGSHEVTPAVRPDTPLRFSLDDLRCRDTLPAMP